MLFFFLNERGDQRMSMSEVSLQMNDRPENTEIFHEIAALSSASRMAELRDEYNKNHIRRVQSFCRILATELQKDTAHEKILTDAYITNLYHAAAFHDIGKIGIPEHILLKRGRLEPEEFEIMKLHVDIGKRTLRELLSKYRSCGLIKLSFEMTAYHHEKWDGSGYPDGLYARDIPLSARIMALVDVYDALRSKRPYKEPISHEKSVRIIKEGGGVHFDPSVVKAFSNVESIFEEIYRAMEDDTFRIPLS
jgi:putative two-component system response regulator